MADPPPYPDTSDDTGERGPAASTPRRALVLGIIIATVVLVLLLVVLHLTGTLGPDAH